jgi:hypothetical protein
MITDFVLADYGWLAGSVHVIFWPGKNCDGYMSNNNILKQAALAMKLVQELYLHEDHLFIYNNATTHPKCLDALCSAQKMPENPKEWLVECPICGSNGRVILGQKTEVQMQPGCFKGHIQSFYYPLEHELGGQFKGMTQIFAK